MTGPAPVRVMRKGMSRWFHPTRDQLKRACQHAEAEARKTRWRTTEHLTGFLVEQIGDQLACPCVIEIAGEHGPNDEPMLEIRTEHYSHFVALRDVHVDEAQPILGETARTAIDKARTAFSAREEPIGGGIPVAKPAPEAPARPTPKHMPAATQGKPAPTRK